MARRGIMTLAGLVNGGGVNVPPPNPPGPGVPPPPPPVGDQTTVLPLVASAITVFAATVTRTLLAPQNVTLPFITTTQTTFAPTVVPSPRVVAPLVTNVPAALSPSVIASGTFTELFGGTDGANWDSTKWMNKRVTTAGIGDIQSGTGRLSTGTITNYAGFAGYMTVLAYADFEQTGSYIVQGTNVVYPLIGFRSSPSWSTTHGSALDSYWLEFKRNEFGVYLYKRVGNTPSLVASNMSFSYSTGDTIHWRINAQGTTIRIAAWKNAEADPAGNWSITAVDASHASGHMYLSANGGPDNLADEVRFDNITIVGGSVGAPPPPPPPPPPTSTLTRIGATWTSYRPAPSMDSALSVMETQAQHIIGFGTDENPANELNPSLGVYNWGALDPYVQDIIDAGATKPIIIFCRAPGWMKAVNFTQNDETPTPANFGNYATLCAAVAARYTQVKYFSVWNEMKGSLFYNNTLNRWNYEDYTSMYNQIWTKVKAVRPDAKIGGPYVILQSGKAGTSWSHGPTTGLLAFPGGSHDQRQVDVMTYFRDNALGFDFLSCDGGIENQFPKQQNGTVLLQDQIPVDPYLQIQKLWGWWVWVRANIHPTCELFNFETYVNQTGATHGYTEAQKEDLFIELARKTQQNVPNPNVSYLTWMSPGFRPQVVARGANDFVWANTASGFGPKVQAWHGTTPPPPPPTTTDLLTMFLARYPATGAEIFVSTAGNDSNAGTSGAPKRTVQGAINIASAGSRIRVLAGNYNDGAWTWAGKNGTQTNWIRMVCDPGVTFQVAGGGGGQGLSQLKNCSFIAIWGGDWVGVNNSSNPYEIAHLSQFGGHSFAIWGGLYRNIGGAHIATLNAPGRFDICYNEMHTGSQWNENQTSAFSALGMTDVGTAWPDGYQNHIIGNVIHNIWTEEHLIPGYPIDPAFLPTDGNCIILDRNGAFTGKSLIAHNLGGGCGGRGIHLLETHHTDSWLNTMFDNCHNLAGLWLGELSITESTDCRMEWNVAAARPGNNRVGVYTSAGTSFWGNNVFLRGTGGEDSVSPSVNANGNVNRTATGPAGYFVNYQPGVFMSPSITDVAGFRPKLAQVQKFTPPANVRAAVAPWPDALGVLRPASGDWAYGAFEGA